MALLPQNGEAGVVPHQATRDRLEVTATRIVLAHDYLTQRGGAERVALHLAKAFPAAPFFTSVYAPRATYEGFESIDVRTSYLQRLGPVRRDPRLGLPLLANAWSTLSLPDADVVIASSSGWAHGVRAPEGARKIVYCHNPPRWLYQTDQYCRSTAQTLALRAVRSRLTAWDQRAARSADLYLANSTSVARRIEQVYGVEAVVAFPPMTMDTTAEQTPVEGLEPGFWLTVARGRGYKNVQAVSEGVGLFGEGQLAIVGSSAPTTGARPHERWCGVVSDAQLRWLYANARGLISVSHEDFGLTPLEANAFGTPAVVLRDGGFLDSTAPGVSGWWVEEPTAPAVLDALLTLPSFDADAVRCHADGFSADAFSRRIRALALGKPVRMSTREPVARVAV